MASNRPKRTMTPPNSTPVPVTHPSQRQRGSPGLPLDGNDRSLLTLRRSGRIASLESVPDAVTAVLNMTLPVRPKPKKAQNQEELVASRRLCKAGLDNRLRPVFTILIDYTKEPTFSQEDDHLSPFLRASKRDKQYLGTVLADRLDAEPRFSDGWVRMPNNVRSMSVPEYDCDSGSQYWYRVAEPLRICFRGGVVFQGFTRRNPDFSEQPVLLARFKRPGFSDDRTFLRDYVDFDSPYPGWIGERMWICEQHAYRGPTSDPVRLSQKCGVPWCDVLDPWKNSELQVKYARRVARDRREENEASDQLAVDHSYFLPYAKRWTTKVMTCTPGICRCMVVYFSVGCPYTCSEPPLF
jgi:hypothetical protein